MVDRKLVAISLDPEEDEEPVYCTYDLDGHFQKVRDLDTDSKKTMSFQNLIQQFFQLDLPYIVYHDANPFELLDDECETLKTRIFKVSDGVLERDTIIGNEVGCKFKKERVEKIGDHFYLPGKPDLIYESYPFFKPDLEQSEELNNDEFMSIFVTKFLNFLSKSKLKGFQNGKLLYLIKDLLSFQTPVEYQNYFTMHAGEFYDVFHDRIFQVIQRLYTEVVFHNSDKYLRKFFNGTDSSYHPILNETDNVSLKPIGSVAQSPYAFGISDADTQFLNALLVHVELVNLSLGIGEGYELYFNSTKSNFKDHKLVGPDSTKVNNFLKYFTKCVSICLNSKTNKFIIMDYYWIGVFEIQDIQDGEIEDVKRLISKVKVRHFSFSNFEKNVDPKLTIRSIVGSFFFTVSPAQYKSTTKKMDSLNKRVVQDWELFKKSHYSNLISKSNNRKRFKVSPFTFTTPTGFKFQKQKVDLEKALIKFIAIGNQWSCQTLSVDIKKLFQDKLHYSQLNLDGVGKEVLLSIYDQQYDSLDFNFIDYYRDGNKLIMPKASLDPVFGLAQKDRAVDESYLRWISSVDVYEKLIKLQGDVIAKVIDYGFLEDKAYNGDELHFKTDGYYIVYEPISHNFQDMTPIDPKVEEHYKLAKETLSKVHELGVSINPHIRLGSEVLRYYKGKVYIINLEEANTMATKSSKHKDMIDLDRIFHKNGGFSGGERSGEKDRKRRHSHNYHNHGFHNHNNNSNHEHHHHHHQHTFDVISDEEDEGWSIDESEDGDDGEEVLY